MKLSTLLGLALLCIAAGGNAADESSLTTAITPSQHTAPGKPVELQLQRAGSKKFDLRQLPQTKPKKQERPELEEPDHNPVELPGGPQPNTPALAPGPTAPAPAPTLSFDGLDFATWGGGHPPDTNGDVGPTYYIQTINTSIGVYRKSDQVRVAAFTFNTFMSQGNFGNLCDTDNFGDPVVLYDTFEDRWIITDFAFQLSGSTVINPPGSFQCFAVSKTGDPVAGGWNFYSINTAGGLGDYPKFGVWTDGLYVTANMFNYAGSAFLGPRVYAFNKAQMYAGSANVQVVSFDAPTSDFAILPSNARLQTGTPPAGTPNYFVSSWQFLNALTVYKFHVDWSNTLLSSFTGPDAPLASTSWPNANVPNAPSLGGNSLDVLQIRAMVQSQYSNIGGAESLWVTHTVRRQDTSGFAAPRWYQVDVTGGSVAANLPQATTWDPDGANVMHRFMPSIATDRAGDIALGYSTSSSTTKPAMMYAGRLAGEPVNTFSQTEQLLFQGAGTQTGNCGGSACTRWGDYSAMTLDPDGCTFWYTNEYYAVDGLNFLTRIGSFSYPSCTPVGAGGTVSGTVTETLGGTPLAGATVMLGSRATTTNGSGFYSFPPVPAGTYPTISASAPGYSSTSVNSIVVTDGNTTNQDIALATAATSGCLTDTSQADFLAGVSTNLDLSTSPGDVTLTNAPTLDQSSTGGTTTGTSVATTLWEAQTFTPSMSAQLTKVDVELFCSGCTGTTPNLTLSVRNTSAGLPTGADLASVTIPGFSSGSAVYYTASFGSPATLTSGTQYALVLRPVSAPSAGSYAWIRSSPGTYTAGQRASSADNGGTWIPDSTRDFNFRAYMYTGYVASGNLISSTKDANPIAGSSPNWTLSWTASTPANTALQFQVAASNSSSGPFNFVGPDGTAGTYFTTSGASLSQFNGSRYVQYRSYLTTTNGAVTPTMNDVTMCFADIGPTTTALTSDANPSVFGQNVTFTATVSANVGTPTGTVTFLDGGTPIGSAPLSSGAATLMTSTLASGNHTVTANYAGDGTYNPSSGSLDTNPQVVNQDATTTAVTSSVNPSANLQSVTFTATVAAVAPGSGTPTGTVTFLADTTVLGSPALNGSGQAGVTTSSLAVGNHPVTAHYNGDANFSISTGSLPGGQTVIPGTPNLSLGIDDSHLFARYGMVLDYLVTLSNSGNGTATNVNVSSTASAGLDAASTTWVCTDGGGGATCTASSTGPFADTATLPPHRSLNWLVSVPVLSNTSDNTVSLSVSASGASSATDVDTLVIFRDSFDVPNGDGTMAPTPSPENVGVLSGSVNQLFTLPAPSGNAIADVLTLSSGSSQVRVQSVTLGKTTWVRVLTQANGQERASAWAGARAGATLSVASVSADGKRVILLEGAEKSLSAPLVDSAQ